MLLDSGEKNQNVEQLDNAIVDGIKNFPDIL